MSFSRESLLHKLSELARLAGPPRRNVVAFSGGLDSTVLLHALRSSQDGAGPALLAVHVDHGLQPESRAWAAHCEKFAAQLGVEFLALRAAVDLESGQGPEAAARTARYDALRGVIEHGDWLLSAHHRDDQAETLLLNLLRGSGPSGLAGIGTMQPFAAGWLVRPLLAVARDELAAYAARNRLEWIEDPSNEDRRLDRNYLRHEIMPRLEARWPEASRRLRRSAELAGDAATLLDQLADLDLQAAGARPARLALDVLNEMPAERQRNLLRYVVRELGLPPPPGTALQSIVGDLLPARDDAQPLVQWTGAEVRRYRDSVYVLPRMAEGQAFEPRASAAGRIELGPALGELRLEPGAPVGLSDAVIRAGLSARFRRGGEEIKAVGQAHTKTLKKLLQEACVVPWMRDRVPLLYSGDALVAVADLWLAESAASRPGTAIRWHDRPPLH